MEKVVFLFDVDNTLLDNDRVSKDLRSFLETEVGAERNNHYWEIFEELRNELGYADYLGALQRYRIENPYDSHLLAVSTYLVNYPFANRLFPNSLDVLDYCRQFGKVVILSDGDVVFQPRKVERSGLLEAVEKNVLITSTRNTNCPMSNGVIRRNIMFWLTIKSAFCRRSKKSGARRSQRFFRVRDITLLTKRKSPNIRRRILRLSESAI